MGNFKGMALSMKTGGQTTPMTSKISPKLMKAPDTVSARVAPKSSMVTKQVSDYGKAMQSAYKNTKQF